MKDGPICMIPVHRFLIQYIERLPTPSTVTVQMELLSFSPCKISHIAKSASMIRYSREEFWNVSNHLGSCNRSEPTVHPC